MEKENINGPMGQNMRENIKMELEKGLEYINGKMEEYLKVRLKMENLMEKEFLHIKENQSSVNILMVDHLQTTKNYYHKVKKIFDEDIFIY